MAGQTKLRKKRRLGVNRIAHLTNGVAKAKERESTEPKVPPKVVLMRVKDIKGRPYNPNSRAERSTLLPTLRSIDEIGLLYPLLVKADGRLVDGHGRLWCVKTLKWEFVPVIIAPESVTVERIYADVNSTNRKMSGTENLEIWLKEPRAVTVRAARAFAAAEERFGRKLLEKLVSLNMSIRLIRRAVSIARYVGADENEVFVRQAAHWLLRHRNTQLVQSYIAMEAPARTLYTAVRLNRPLTSKIGVGK